MDYVLLLALMNTIPISHSAFASLPKIPNPSYKSQNEIRESKDMLHSGLFSNNINIFTEETTPDEVVKSFALSLALGGNYSVDRLTLQIKKMKEKDFLKIKTTIPEKFYTLNGV